VISTLRRFNSTIWSLYSN